jgi:phosphoserine/homoserine phosphotransferase
VIVLSDTFVEFVTPLIEKLNFPTLLCHNLSIDAKGRITAYHIRKENAKKAAVQAFQGLNYETIAMGDSYNDTAMLSAADHGILFRPPENVINEFPQFPVFETFADLKTTFTDLLELSASMDAIES